MVAEDRDNSSRTLDPWLNPQTGEPMKPKHPKRDLHISILQPDESQEVGSSFQRGEEVPNSSLSNVEPKEDTGRAEERFERPTLKRDRMSIPKSAEMKSLFHHLKDRSASGSAAPETPMSPQLQQLQQQISRYLHPHFGGGDDDERQHRFQAILRRGFRRSRTNADGSSKRQSMALFRDAEEELEFKNREKTEFVIRSLITGYPEVLLTSSFFLTDEHDQRKVPLLLSLLSVSLTEVTKSKSAKKRVFKLTLEYGIGDSALRWTIYRDYKQMLSFNNRLRIQVLQANVIQKGVSGPRKEIELPKFPKFKASHNGVKSESANTSPVQTPGGPRSLRKERAKSLPSGKEDKRASAHTSEGTARTATVTDLRALDRTLEPTDSESSLDSTTSTLSGGSHAWRRTLVKLAQNLAASKTNQSLRDNLQEYFDELIKCLLMRPESTKLLQFLELSPMSVMLSHENVEKKKEGYLMIKTSAKAQGWRVGHLKYRDFKAMVVRHTAKWFIVGHSYILYVSDINSTTPLDVFLVDSKFNVTLTGLKNIANKSKVPSSEYLLQHHSDSESSDEEDEMNPDELNGKGSSSDKSYISMTMENSERKLSVMSKSVRQLKSWCRAIHEMSLQSEWAAPHRFDSFAPVRDNCFAQWFVDARDYMWAASSAMEMAKDTIYIHDWWLTPELYMRRPGDGNQEWRIDRILKRKAMQGVKIFVIVYRNVGNTVVTDSLWTKHSLLDLHPNVHVLRSPNQLTQNVYFWAHHEKLLIVDQMVCFLGGIDLCYGRWDTPDHSLVDDSPYAFRSQIPADVIKRGGNVSCQSFPGKDYSNPRVSDFFELQQPFKDMYNRQIVPRMPWHDVHMVTCGQIARDLSRHFVQRWNYVLRQKRPSRPTPLLLPPRDLTPEELEGLKFNGTCEIQLLRSSCFWSLGLTEHEQSIQNAYVKCIETSEHFIYIENQFFVTSCEVDGVMVLNHIGDALVERIIRADRNKEAWRAVIVIPLLPGFESDVDRQDGSAVRLITRCQYMSISMGESSIFGKLRKKGIVPENYIQFYSLRRWGMIGTKKVLVTEQLYIHAKVMVSDDRIAIIGSANINERSMRGTRDSEICAIVRDKDLVNISMDGKPYKAAKFAHTLRMRLMREHLGVDVDLLDLVERRFSAIEAFSNTSTGLLASTLANKDEGSQQLSAMVELGTRYLLHEHGGTAKFNSSLTVDPASKEKLTAQLLASFNELDSDSGGKSHLDDIPYVYSFNHRAGKENVGIRDKKPFSTDTRVTAADHREDVLGYGTDKYQSDAYLTSKERMNGFLEKVAEQASAENGPLPDYEDVIEFLESAGEGETADELNRERWVMLKRLFYMQKLESRRRQEENGGSVAVDQSPSSAEDTNDDSILGSVPSIPTVALTDEEIRDIDHNSLPVTRSDFVDPYAFEDPLDIDFYEGTWMPQAIRNTMIYRMVFHTQPDDTVNTWNDYKEFQELKQAFMDNEKIARGFNESDKVVDELAVHEEEIAEHPQYGANGGDTTSLTRESSPDEDLYKLKDAAEEFPSASDERRRVRRARMADLDRFQRSGGLASGSPGSGMIPNAVYDYNTAKKLLGLVKGRIVQFPTRWLKQEVEGSNWFYKADKLPPIQIYN